MFGGVVVVVFAINTSHRVGIVNGVITSNAIVFVVNVVGLFVIVICRVLNCG